MDLEKIILNKMAQGVAQDIDQSILFENLAQDWYKMEITFGKDRYHQQEEMASWCRNNIGPGGWSYTSPKEWAGLQDKIWIMHSMFGNTTFAFKEPQHLTLFALRWAS